MSDVERFYRALEGGVSRPVLRRMAEGLLAAAGSADERRRWERWAEALARPGGKIKYRTIYRAHVIVGPDLEALERGRREMKDETLIDRLAEQEDP